MAWSNPYANVVKGRRTDKPEDTSYYKSTWERNLARLWEWLVDQEALASWSYETIKLSYHIGKRGKPRMYRNDFPLVLNDGTQVLVECKGRFGPAERRKLSNVMEKNPDVLLVMIDAAHYYEIERTFGPLIPNWEGGRVNRLEL